MCTISWLPGVGSYRLWVTRDERRGRLPGEPPHVRALGARQALAPRDPEGGGTWAGVNDLGFAFALANHYPDPAPQLPERRTSRGQVIEHLLAVERLGHVWQALEHLPLVRFLPFTLVVVSPARAPLLFTWNGDTLATHGVTAPGLLVTSSSVRDTAVRARRERAFAAAAPPAGAPLEAEHLEAFHRSHGEEDGAEGVCMHRPDAQTVSLLQVEVDGTQIRMRYHDGAPCTATTPGHFTLARARAARVP